MKRRQLALIIFLILCLAGLAMLLFAPSKIKTGVQLDIVPSDAEVLIDSKIHSKLGATKLTAGIHNLKVSRRGFASAEVRFSVSDGKITGLNLALKPSSSVGEKWLKDHPEETLKAEGFSGAAFDQQVNTIRQTTPLIASLPFTDQLFRVDYGASKLYPQDSTAVAIYITYYSEDGKQQALDWIRFKGYDPAKLEIIYESKIGS
ncbi:MAG TPA: hypothetical protein VLG37_03425 [Candidatus Saccharimonadales bacterium]|nr:hypothetical protein [Candidatus Saccharimonadales bacterium]